ncbi:MAG: flagellar basal body-associated protein FliL [Sulfurospirillum sp.]|nr:flagellar basal body-associated protein FliL [Sulfurospirillum sp.]
MAEEMEDIIEGKSGGNIVLILIIVLLVILLVGGGLAAFFLFGDSDEVVIQPQQNIISTSTEKKTSKRSNIYLKIGPMYSMDQFVVNLLSEGGRKYLKVILDIELDKKELAKELDMKKSLTRDIIIQTLSSKTFEEVSTIKGKENLKDEIVSQINNVLADGQIVNIFFTDFVVQ